MGISELKKELKNDMSVEICKILYEELDFQEVCSLDINWIVENYKKIQQQG
jgi:hypothetical protein